MKAAVARQRHRASVDIAKDSMMPIGGGWASLTLDAVPGIPLGLARKVKHAGLVSVAVADSRLDGREQNVMEKKRDIVAATTTTLPRASHEAETFSHRDHLEVAQETNVAAILPATNHRAGTETMGQRDASQLHIHCS
jgi:hypothetical protein